MPAAPAFVAGRGPQGATAAGSRRLGEQRERFANLGQQRFAVERLGQIGEHAARGGFHRIGNGAVRGQQDHRQGRVPLANPVEQREAVAARQLHVAQDELRPFHIELSQRRFGRIHGTHEIAGRTEPHRQQPEHVRVVVHHQDARRCAFDRRHGRPRYSHQRGPAGTADAASAGPIERSAGVVPRLRSIARTASSRWFARASRSRWSRNCRSARSSCSSSRRCSPMRAASNRASGLIGCASSCSCSRPAAPAAGHAPDRHPDGSARARLQAATVVVETCRRFRCCPQLPFCRCLVQANSRARSRARVRPVTRCACDRQIRAMPPSGRVPRSSGRRCRPPAHSAMGQQGAAGKPLRAYRLTWAVVQHAMKAHLQPPRHLPHWRLAEKALPPAQIRSTSQTPTAPCRPAGCTSSSASDQRPPRCRRSRAETPSPVRSSRRCGPAPADLRRRCSRETGERETEVYDAIDNAPSPHAATR